LNLGEKSDLSAGWAIDLSKKAQHRSLCEHFLERSIAQDAPNMAFP